MKIFKIVLYLSILISLGFLPSNAGAEIQSETAPGHIFLSTKNDVDYTSLINLAKESGNASLLGLFRARSYSDKDIQVIYGVFPEWAIREPQIDDTFLKNSLDLYRSIAKEQRENLSRGVPYARLSPAQQSLVSRIFVESPVPGAAEPEQSVINRRVKFGDIVQDEKAVFRLTASPNVFVYIRGDYLGKISLATDEPYKLAANTRKMGTDIGVFSWAHFPTRIEPSIQIPSELSNNIVSFGKKPQTLTVEELLRRIDPTGKRLIADKVLKDIQVVTFGEAIRVSDVIRALSIALGSEARVVGTVTFISRSQIHQFVAETALTVLDSVYTRDSMTQGFSRLISDTLQTYKSPFPAQSFLGVQLREFRDLSDAEQAALKPLVPDTATADDIKVRFVPFISASIVGTERGTMISSSISAVPPDVPLRQPAGNTWKSYIGERIEADSKVKVVFDGTAKEGIKGQK